MQNSLLDTDEPGSIINQSPRFLPSKITARNTSAKIGFLDKTGRHSAGRKRSSNLLGYSIGLEE